MWRSFFLAVGIFLFLIGLESLAVQQFSVDKNNRLFSFARRANRALDSAGPNGQQNSLGQNGIGLSNGQGSNFANQQQFSLPSSGSYYGGPSRFQASGYQSAYGGPQQSIAANQVSNTNNYQAADYNLSTANLRPKRLQTYPINDWMPWGFLAAGTIISLYTKSTGVRYSGE